MISALLKEYEKNLRVRLIRTPELLLKAAQDMRNCSGSYVNRVSNAQYLLCIVEDTDPKRESAEPKEFMLGLRADKYGKLEFDQVKASSNRQGSDRFKKNMMEYLQEKEISYQELADLRLSSSPRNESDSNLETLLNNLRVNNLLDVLRGNDGNRI